MSKKLLIVAALSAVCLSASAQAVSDQAGAWLSVQLNKGWNGAYAFARFEHRSVNCFQDPEAWFGLAGAGYKFTPWLKADLSYEYWNIYPETVNHKIVLCTTGTHASGPLSVALREKWEHAINPAGGSSDILRSRLRAQYSAPESVVRPYIMSEIFTWTDFSSPFMTSWKRSLYYVGADIVINKHSSFDVFYLYHLPNGSAHQHIIGLGYVHNL